MQPYRTLQMGKGLTCNHHRVSLVSGEASNHRAVLPLYPRPVILAVSPRTGEVDTQAFTVPYQSLVDEHTVIVRFYTGEWDRKDPGDGLQTLDTSHFSRASNGTALAHPELTSMATRLWTNVPLETPPLCDARYISRYPGVGSFQSVKSKGGSKTCQRRSVQYFGCTAA